MGDERTILPDCMMPDGGDPCIGYSQCTDERDRLAADIEKWKALTNDAAAENAELRRERDELVKMVQERDNWLGQQACRRGRCIQYAELEARVRNTETMLGMRGKALSIQTERAEAAEARIAEVERENGELREDAERYRYLRMNLAPAPFAYCSGFPHLGNLAKDEAIEERIDRMVDAALKGER